MADPVAEGFPRGEGRFTIYLCFDDAGTPRFVGRTRHFKQRRDLHRARGLHAKAVIRVDDLDAALGIEQRFLDELGGPGRA